MFVIVVDMVVWIILTVILQVCVYVMAIPSAYEVSCSSDSGCGMSDVCMLKSVGE